jgi:thymidylate synthase (FAD)
MSRGAFAKRCAEERRVGVTSNYDSAHAVVADLITGRRLRAIEQASAVCNFILSSTKDAAESAHVVGNAHPAVDAFSSRRQQEPEQVSMQNRQDQMENKDQVPENSRSTLRPVVPELEAILNERHSVLDHGFVRVIDYMGDDTAVVQAARVSYGKGTKRANEDRALIHYLLRHQHTTPFEMAEIKFHIKLPIFVARQWIRHRTANVNEYSARYSILDREFYIPHPGELAGQSISNRQGRSEALSEAEANAVTTMLRDDSEIAHDHYRWMLNEGEDGKKIDPGRKGLARELARIGLTVNTYTQWYWKIDLHNLLNFLKLRADQHAQFEIRAYADVLLQILKKWVPVTYDAFVEHRLNAIVLSKSAVDALRRMLAGEAVTAATSGLSAREWNDLIETFGLHK